MAAPLSISPRSPRSWWRARECAWPSMATARFRANAAAPISWRAWASASRWSPADFGGARATSADLRGGDRQTNCAIALAVLGGAVGPHRDIVLVNSAAALVASGKAMDFREGMVLGASSIDSGAAREKAEALA